MKRKYPSLPPSRVQRTGSKRARRPVGRQDLRSSRVGMACRSASAEQQVPRSPPPEPGLAGMTAAPSTGAHQGGPGP